MALTRANVETLLIRRCGKLLAAAGLDGTTITGANGDLNDPLGWAIRQCGGTVASIVAVADVDLASVAADDYDQLFDLAELRALESILGNLDVVTQTVGGRSENLSDLAARVQTRLTEKRALVERQYGVGVGALQTGVIGLDFMQKDEEES